MKQIITSLLILLSITACNNAVNEQPITQQQVPAPEKEMKDAIAKYPDFDIDGENCNRRGYARAFNHHHLRLLWRGLQL